MPNSFLLNTMRDDHKAVSTDQATAILNLDVVYQIILRFDRRCLSRFARILPPARQLMDNKPFVQFYPVSLVQLLHLFSSGGAGMGELIFVTLQSFSHHVPVQWV